MLSPRIAARGRCVTDKSDSVRLSDEQRLDWLSPPIESIELLRALLR
jgi:hypothetical protein